MAQYDGILPENKDEAIQICRYFHWNKQKIENMFDDPDHRVKIGLEYDTFLVKKYP
tara:strand:- start:1116 stop:1283 length:168 start_codon:yes stop_codon:yes gene_type:complete